MVAFNDVQAEAVDATTQRITWTTDTHTTHNVVLYSRDRSYDLVTPLDTSVGTIHEALLTNLLPRTQYNFKLAGIAVPVAELFAPAAPSSTRGALVSPVVDMRLNVFPVARSAPATLVTPSLDMTLKVSPVGVAGGTSLFEPMVDMRLRVNTTGPAVSRAQRGSGVLFDPTTMRLGPQGVELKTTVLLPLQRYKNAILADAPRAYWRLGETSGTTAIDSSGAGFNLDGTYTGGVTLNQPGAIGDGNPSALFNGTSGYIVVPLAGALTLTNDLTLEAWVNLSSYANHCLVINKNIGGGATNSTYEFQVRPDGLLQFVQVIGPEVTQVVRQSTVAVALNTWTHIAVTKVSGPSPLISFYVNGAPAGVVAGVSGVVMANTTNVYIGSRPDFYSYAVGRLDEIAVYPTALSAEKIAAHYAARIGQ